jgi:uncharacterized membrane protein/mono/diheme cytochrome c family protein
MRNPMAQTPEEKHGGPLRIAAALGAFGAWLCLFYLALRMPPDGHERGNLGQFLGRLHPLLVHGPVALLALIPFMEIAGLRSRWSHLRLAVGWIFAVAVVAAYAAGFDGWLLAWSGGFRGHDVTRHMWGGVWLAGVSAAALWFRCLGSKVSYPVLLAFAFGLMVWTGHGGGSISHGDDFLTEKMPVRLRLWLGIASAAPAQAAVANSAPVVSLPHGGPASANPANPAFYAVHVAPLFARSCLSCHKPAKHKGGLRMDTYAELMLGGEDGPVVVPGKPDSSDIIRRLRLPPSDDDSMPSDGDKPLTPEEIQMVEHWIAAGAKSS